VADQTGAQILDQIVTATNVEVSFTLLELTQENFELLLGKVLGAIYTGPSSDVVGLGDSKRFKNMSLYAGELVLKPVGAVDNSRNWHFWKVSPMIDAVNYSGADLSNMSIAWKALRDKNKDASVNLCVFGDGEQLV